MRRSLAVAVIVAAAVTAPAADAGAPIRTLSACSDSYLFVTASTPSPRFKAALVCLINAARKAQHLPALHANDQLASVAQAQSDKFAKTGSGSHGRSLADIGRRFETKGYRPAAYNEGFDFLFQGASPYAFLADMMRQPSVPCSEILDPRFRDIGVGFSPGGQATTLALEFGLRRGARQPSTDYSRSATCPHAVPKPKFASPPLAPAGLGPSADASGVVSLQVSCSKQADCVFSGTLTLAHAGVKQSTAGAQTIPAGETHTLTFAFAPADVQSELAASQPAVSLDLTVTRPIAYSDRFEGPLSGSL